MASSPPVRREFHIHPAHVTVGVGATTAFHPYYRSADSVFGDTRTEPLRVLLARRGAGTGSPTGLALLEEHLRGRHSVQIANVECGDVDADCLIMLGRGLRMAGRWSDLDANTVAPSDCQANDARPMEVEPVAAACGHPVLDGIRPFVSRCGVDPCVGVPIDATCLLTGKIDDERHPLAWAWRGQQGRIFQTVLGRVDHFHQPDFCRLVLNAVDWVGRRDQRA